MVNEMNKCNANKRTRRCLKRKKINFFCLGFFFCYTFSSFDGVETDIGAFPLDVFVAGKRLRFNRIGFVSFVDDVVSFDDVSSKRLVIDGVEQGNGISTTIIKTFFMVCDFFDTIKVIYLIEHLI